MGRGGGSDPPPYQTRGGGLHNRRVGHTRGGESWIQPPAAPDTFTHDFKPLTTLTPRALVPLANVPVIDYTIGVWSLGCHLPVRLTDTPPSRQWWFHTLSRIFGILGTTPLNLEFATQWKSTSNRFDGEKVFVKQVMILLRS